MTTILLENALVLALGEADHIFDPGFVLIEDGRIAAVGRQATSPASYVDERVDCRLARSLCPVWSMPTPTRP